MIITSILYGVTVVILALRINYIHSNSLEKKEHLAGLYAWLLLYPVAVAKGKSIFPSIQTNTLFHMNALRYFIAKKEELMTVLGYFLTKMICLTR